MRTLILVVGLLVLNSISTSAQKAKPISIYTNLTGKNCRVVKPNKSEAGSSSEVRKCNGVGNYSLLVLDDDNRMSLTLLTPDGKTHPLELWTIITKSFSTLGEKVEWRVSQKHGAMTPHAFIVRVHANIQEDPDKPQRKSYLAVGKITSEKVCVTNKVDASADANIKARQLADASGQKDCLQS